MSSTSPPGGKIEQVKLDIKTWPLPKDPPLGMPALFLGRDTKTYGEAGTGWVEYVPEYECGGIYGKTAPDYQCPFTLAHHDNNLDLNKRDAGSDTPNKEDRKLHVMIASYRDPLCPITLFNLFTKAAYPELLHVNVLMQNDPEVDDHCLKVYCKMIQEHKDNAKVGGNHEPLKTHSLRNSFDLDAQCPHADQVYIHEIHAKDAKGPTFARGMLSADMDQQYHDGKLSPQDYCMSTDSHMDFTVHWDKDMVEMWHAAENEYAVLSSYVNDVERMADVNGRKEVPHLCMITYTSNVRTHATKCARALPRPKLTNAVWGAGLSFSKCHADLKAQVDPHTPHIFDGEEFNRAARFFTHGYDIYTPNASHVYHDYHRSQANPVMHTWGKSFSREEKIYSEYRLSTMIDLAGGEKDKDKSMAMKRSKYGLGDRRTLDQLIDFTGFGLRERKITIDGKNRCGNTRWVPFREHTKGVNYIPRFDVEENPLDPPDETGIWHEGQGKVDEISGAGAVQNKILEENMVTVKKGVERAIETADVMRAEKEKETFEGQVQNSDSEEEEEESSEEEYETHIMGFNDVPDHVAKKIAAAVQNSRSNSILHPPSQGVSSKVSNLRSSGNTQISISHHGFGHLPLPIKLGVIVLTLGLCLTFLLNMSSNSGRKVLRKRRKLKRNV
uniref:Uncharacterized protein n=1 Tax=Leptocylindrus danicus TaxID=163516 RepID=A0A7S2P201_9STRA